MFIAHIPAGYLLSKAILRRTLTRYEWLALATGSVFPDLDLLRFYLLDHRQIHHHHYWTHRPFVWACIWTIALLLSRSIGRKPYGAVHVFFICVFLHLVLDTLAGDIGWCWPFSHHHWTLVTIKNTHNLWVMNFLLHWTFGVEILICLLAGWVFYKTDSRRIFTKHV